jgi:acyl-coenzyme A thioesterase PaaI-like protein
MSNRFSRFINKVNYAPKKLRPFLLTKFFCSTVKFAGTTGIKIKFVSHEQVEITLANKKKVQNHIGGVHAVAAALLAESATGIVFGMNVPDDSVPLLKSMNIEYQRRMQGSLTAVAKITETQRQAILQQEKGDMMIAVEITDESNEQPIVCHMDWAWVKKRR